VVRETAPLQNSNSLGNKIQRHLKIPSARYGKIITEATYYQPCVVSDLSFVTTNDWELVDKLREMLPPKYVVRIDEHT
jgi:hypothetical protein